MVRELAAAHPWLSLELTIEPTSHLHAHLPRVNVDVAVVEENVINWSLG